MKTRYLLLLMTFAVILQLSCQKDLHSEIRETTSLVQGKWQVESIVINQNIGGVLNKTTHVGTVQDYVEFSSDNKMYTFFNNTSDTSHYEVKNETTIIIDGDNATIRTLTPGQFVLYSKDKAGSVGYVEIIYNLKK